MLDIKILHGVGWALHEAVVRTVGGTRVPDFVITCCERPDEKHKVVPATHHKVCSVPPPL